ncbi:unnamed protein product [Protopolystoma xenopodis]|uniref:Uncharacterized protein n=1 Tax=Protopolystoma xenopodis TaxID=117903 RepID=A0A448WXT6_9PLAT|nr:unnamed protein product [Protopolystoma xenopodis]
MVEGVVLGVVAVETQVVDFAIAGGAELTWPMLTGKLTNADTDPMWSSSSPMAREELKEAGRLSGAVASKAESKVDWVANMPEIVAEFEPEAAEEVEDDEEKDDDDDEEDEEEKEFLAGCKAALSTGIASTNSRSDKLRLSLATESSDADRFSKL